MTKLLDPGGGGGVSEDTGLNASQQLSEAVSAAKEFNGHIDAALAEARSLFSSVITEGSSQRARIHAERSAVVSAIEAARNRAIAAIHNANGDSTAGTADSPTIRRQPAYLTEC